MHARAVRAERPGRACSDGARSAGEMATRSANAGARRAQTVDDAEDSDSAQPGVTWIL